MSVTPSDPPDRDFGRLGYLHVKGVFSAAECQALRQEADRLAARPEVVRPDNLRTEMRDVGGAWEINKFDPVADVSATIASVAVDRRITEMVGALLSEEVHLFKDKLIYKHPGHGGFGPHQDQTWYRQFPADLIAVMLSIDPAGAQNGAVEVAEGFHRAGNPVPENEVRDLRPDECPPESAWRLIPMSAGDLLIFDNLMPHRSGPNHTDRPRRALFLTYNRSSAGDLRLDYYAYRRTLMLRSNGESKGNFYVSPEFRGTADFFPPVRPHVQTTPRGGRLMAGSTPTGH